MGQVPSGELDALDVEAFIRGLRILLIEGQMRARRERRRRGLRR